MKILNTRRGLQHLAVYASMLLLCGASELALANEQSMYQFLPADTVVSHVKDSLQTHGVDPSTLQISADDQGVVNVSGNVASKLEAENISRWAMHSAGVYGVLGELRYETPASDSAEQVTP